jgi:isoleucyl-tRNA synthetase
VTGAIELWRSDKTIGSSLQAIALLSPEARDLIGDTETWADICITSGAVFGLSTAAMVAEGKKCERCWRVLEEVGAHTAHPTLCTRCCEAVAA